ncbi:restriction endonuclease subunit S [Burkholderia contaminans]|uniref:restriction endonuclease subunit S n=1 Tax=Burkholderia contaminans TaxID=488447 RepID=UPI000F5ACCAC|nr:restriction endonuclease subunit S [Burkholderia contaminans]RQT03272.1 restriction endonuclease subunit S [Burkholderia contaminans]
MDLNSGYKQTEMGGIPEDWDVVLFKEQFYISAGGDAKPELSSSYQDEVHCFPIYSNSLTDAGLYGYCSYSDHPAKSITITARGTLGVATYRDHEYTAIGRVLVLEPKRESVGSFFAEYINSQVEFAIESTGVPQLTAPQIGAYSIVVPPLPEQTAIAEALGDVNALLSGLDKLIAKKGDLKQAAMRQLLTGKTRLPGFGGAWDVRKIGEFTDCTAGGTPSTWNSDYWGGNIRWMNSGELNLRRVHEVEGRITIAGLNNSSTKVIPSGCVLIGLAGQGRTRGTVAMNYLELCTNQSIAAIFPNSSFSSEYLYQNLDSRYEELRELSSGGGGRGGLNLTLIKGLEIPFPSIEEQTAIAEVLFDMDSEVAALEAQRDKTRLLKQGMMQELLTGKTRLI